MSILQTSIDINMRYTSISLRYLWDIHSAATAVIMACDLVKSIAEVNIGQASIV